MSSQPPPPLRERSPSPGRGIRRGRSSPPSPHPLPYPHRRGRVHHGLGEEQLAQPPRPRPSPHCPQLDTFLATAHGRDRVMRPRRTCGPSMRYTTGQGRRQHMVLPAGPSLSCHLQTTSHISPSLATRRKASSCTSTMKKSTYRTPSWSVSLQQHSSVRLPWLDNLQPRRPFRGNKCASIFGPIFLQW